ncbi:alpha/beta hydrolase family protein [Massilia sp. S19_KUP03_FR1]|uniref:alpha/beta hydrolase family protein n=1 Tax=Massilia sp. S19_KUP03_FR1 TaxID=3025503 RepID=UPI002FCD7882
MPSLRHICLFLLLGAGMGLALAAPAPMPASRVPVDVFFAHASFGGAVLSPNGKSLAARGVAKNGRQVLVVIDLATRDGTLAAAYNDADIRQFQWVNDERLVYTLGDRQLAEGQRVLAPGLYAVNRDGSKPLQLAERDASFVREGSRLKNNILPWHTYLMAPGAQDTDFIYVSSPAWDDSGYGNNIEHVDLLRLNTLTGSAQAVPRPGNTMEWLLDQKGQPRLATTRKKDVASVYYRDPATDAWRIVASYDAYLPDAAGFEPIGFGPDGALYVTSTQHSDTASLRRFDLVTGQVTGQALIAAPGFDVDAELVGNRATMLGARISTDARSMVWFDPAMQATQAAIDQALPGMVNLVTVAADPAAPWLLVESFSDKVPSRYFLYKRATRELSPVGNSHAAIDPARMGSQEMVHYKARDGLVIPALLTLPAGGVRKGLPLVVLVHGGPWVRGATWGWDAQSQFLASRGYAVLEPSFRGSTGLGHRHFSAGFKQWGLAMQDDLADGARWAIAQGVADPARICIAGASYGGYAVLMGLINDPALYKCGVEWAGVTDLALMYNDAWFTAGSDADDNSRKYGMPRLLGDPVADAVQLKATSPVEQAARITQPLLMAYGGADRRVPIVHGRRLYSKAKATNARVEWIEYGNEGHGWGLPANRIDFWTRVEKFLDKNIGAAQ